MKKVAIFLSLSIFLVLSLALVSCGQSVQERPTPETLSVEPPAPTEESPTPEPTETLTLVPTLTPTPTIPIIEVAWKSGGPSVQYGITQIVVDPNDPEVVYAFADIGPGVALVWQTLNKGEAWSYLGRLIWKKGNVWEGLDIPHGRPESLRSRGQAVTPPGWGIFQKEFNPKLFPRLDTSEGRPIKSLCLWSAARDGETLVLGYVAPMAGAYRVREVKPDGTKVWKQNPKATDPRYPFRVLVSLKGKWTEITLPLLEPVVGLEASGMAVVTEEGTITLYIGGSEGKVWRTEIPILELDKGLPLQ